MRIAILGSGDAGGYFGAPTSTTRGFVLGYVLEGEIRFGVDGGEQTIYRANQVFCEPPGVLHSVSVNVSPVNPARFLAIVVAENGAQLR